MKGSCLGLNAMKQIMNDYKSEYELIQSGNIISEPDIQYYQ